MLLSRYDESLSLGNSLSYSSEGQYKEMREEPGNSFCKKKKKSQKNKKILLKKKQTLQVNVFITFLI